MSFTWYNNIFVIFCNMLLSVKLSWSLGANIWCRNQYMVFCNLLHLCGRPNVTASILLLQEVPYRKERISITWARKFYFLAFDLCWCVLMEIILQLFHLSKHPIKRKRPVWPSAGYLKESLSNSCWWFNNCKDIELWTLLEKMPSVYLKSIGTKMTRY